MPIQVTLPIRCSRQPNYVERRLTGAGAARGSQPAVSGRFLLPV